MDQNTSWQSVLVPPAKTNLEEAYREMKWLLQRRGDESVRILFNQVLLTIHRDDTLEAIETEYRKKSRSMWSGL